MPVCTPESSVNSVYGTLAIVRVLVGFFFERFPTSFEGMGSFIGLKKVSFKPLCH